MVPDRLDSLNHEVAGLYALGRYGEAIVLAEQAVTLARQTPGPMDSDVATSLNNLAILHKALGDYAAAEPMYREALEMKREALGPEHPDVATSLNNLAMLHHDMGDYAAAEPLYRQALEITREALGPRHRDVATSLNNLAMLLQEMGDYATAEPLHREAVSIWREALGPEHPDVATSLNNLAMLHHDTGDYEAAEPLYEEALGIRREALGPEHPDVAASLNNLAMLYKDMGQYTVADPLYREALGIWREVLGPGHPVVGASLSNLAGLHQAIGNYAVAGPLYREALRIRREALGPEHPDVAVSLNNLAFLCAATDRADEATVLMEEAESIEGRLIGAVFSFGSERQGLVFLESLQRSTDALLSLVLERYLADVGILGRALDVVLRRKAVAAEALAAQRDAVLGGRYPELAGQLRELTNLRMRVAGRILAGPGPEGPEEHRRLIASGEREKETLERALARQIPEMNLEQRLHAADRAAVATALPRGSALVEFVRFIPFDFRAILAQGESRGKPPRYVAFVLVAGEPGSVRLIDLGEADAIDHMIAGFRAAITGRDGDRGVGGADEPGEWQGPGEELRRAVFDPLVPALGDRRRVFLSPDGDLTRIPFEVLPLPIGEPLIEEGWVFSYVSTGRDVLRFGQRPSVQATEALVAADPDFDLGGPSPTAGPSPPPGRRSADLDRAGLAFPRLEGTREEGEAVAARLGVTAVLEGGVLESALKAMRSPRVLHLATHGFFLPDQPRDPDVDLPGLDVAGPLRGSGMENPLLRSGLALAGANTFLGRGSLPPEAEDGLLTAEDVTGLDLLATDLVVLSACETGLGEVRTGEGVFGLCRAFVLAGARTLVMSLWNVPDEPTRDLMEGFYERLLAGEPRAEALRGAQLELMKDSPHPWFWGAFICQGDPGPLARVR